MSTAPAQRVSGLEKPAELTHLAVRASQAFRDWLKTRDRAYLALEMEAAGQERFTSLLDTLRQLAIVLDEPIGAADHPEAHTKAQKKRRGVQEKTG